MSLSRNANDLYGTASDKPAGQSSGPVFGSEVKPMTPAELDAACVDVQALMARHGVSLTRRPANG